jgi:hypothetical protein
MIGCPRKFLLARINDKWKRNCIFWTIYYIIRMETPRTLKDVQQYLTNLHTIFENSSDLDNHLTFSHSSKGYKIKTKIPISCSYKFCCQYYEDEKKAKENLWNFKCCKDSTNCWYCKNPVQYFPKRNRISKL